MSELSRLYDQDYQTWAHRNAELLRARRFAEADLEHLIEELEEMGKSEQRELVSRLRILLAHLLKWQFQYRHLSERWQEFKGESWRATIIEQRLAIRILLKRQPGLKSFLDKALAEAYPQAVELAAAESGLAATSFPPESAYSWAELADQDFYPNPI
jgi:hypothetical protein